ncbi:spermatogenesis-associated protein 24-like, partial [Patella vulgata]|uniref:spermatogenesis-associated protein 24-like n=1 Tax=Patella vulgata TaxID=6465 RepID=UPI0024A96B30
TDKLEFSLGEIEILTKQLEREKLSFGASQMSNRQKDIESKWTETKTRCKNQEVNIQDKDEKIKRLRNLLMEQSHKYKQKVGEIDVEKQQEQYIAQMMEEKTNKKLGTSRKIGSKR